MGSRIKEDERTEKAIRSLLKLPENRRCINCNTLGPQYVCSTFWTFVCINCSGVHREFTHRVKSISMSKFTSEEVNALRAGGNQRAREIYFKEWNTRRDAYPDGSNIFKLRDFIKSVYVDKRYSSSASDDKFSHQKPAITEDYKESKKASANLSGSRSLSSMDKYENEKSSGVQKSGNTSLKFYFDEKIPKQNITHIPKSRGLPKSPIRFEIVDDRFREDGSVKRYDSRRDSRGNSKSLDLSSNKDMSSLPIVRHTSELLGKNGPPLRVEKVVAVEKEKDPLDSQMIVLSDKMENPRSLIDDVPFSEQPDEPINQSSTEISESLKTTNDPAPNSLEALLFGLSVPSGSSETNNYELWSKSDIPSTTSPTNLESLMMSETSENVTSSVSSPSLAHAGSSGLELSVVVTDNLNTIDLATPSVAENDQGPSVTSMEQPTLAITNFAHGVESENQDETNSNMRKALPEDLFTGGFSFAPSQVHNQHHTMGYGMQYYQYPMTMGAFPYTTKPANPFDLSFDDTTPNQTSQFPSMACVQGGSLPHMSAPSNQAADSIGLMTSQSPFYTDPFPPNSLSPGAFMGQESHVNMSQSFRQEINGVQSFHQGNNGYYSSPANPNTYISKGNPFE